MILNLPNVSLLGLAQNSNFFGAGFHYATTRNLTINGDLLDLGNSFGISGIWTGTQGLFETIQNNKDFSDVVLNGFSFGTGRINSFSFDQGFDVFRKQYTATLEVFETGNLFNLTGTYYTGINLDNFQYLQDFSESYNFTKTQNGGYGYTHNANIRFNSGVGQLNSNQAAKQLVRSLFTGSALGFAFYSGYTSKQGKRLYNESYNLIDNTCQFDESFSFDSDQGNYSITRTNEFNQGVDGIITVSENGNLRGIVRPTFQSAIDALNGEISGSYARCTGVFYQYAGPNYAPLLPGEIDRTTQLDLFGNTLSYNISYTNDIQNSGTYFWNYTQQLTRQDSEFLFSENGNVIGRGGNRPTAYLNAKNGFTVVKQGIFGRALSYYVNNTPNTGIFVTTRDEVYSPHKGTVSYGWNFTNEETFPGTGGVKNIRITRQNDNSVYLYTKFGIFNQGEIVQDQSNATAQQDNLNLVMDGENGLALSIYLENAKTYLNQVTPTGINTFISDAGYVFNKNNNSVSVNLGYVYNKTGAKTIMI
jgi:hypothetical protein